MRKTAQTVEESKEVGGVSHGKDSATKKPRHPNSLKNLIPYVKGQSGNPSGRVKNDIAAEIARAIFENDAEAIYRAFAKGLRSGNAYAFSVLADRGFGKLKEKVEHSGDSELLSALEAGRKRTNKQNGDDSTEPAAPSSTRD